MQQLDQALKMKDTLDSDKQSRRMFLEKAGKLAAYTPPTILALMYPGVQAIASGGKPIKDKDKRIKDKDKYKRKRWD